MNTSTTAQCGSEIVGESGEPGLLPCPFCGGRANVYTNEVDFVAKWSVGCGNCNADMDVCEDTPADAVVCWNDRAPSSELAAARKALEGTEALRKAAQDFIDKVDRGDARSRKSYYAFKAALSSKEPEGK